MEDISCRHEPELRPKQTGSGALSQESDRKIKFCFGLSLESLQPRHTVRNVSSAKFFSFFNLKINSSKGNIISIVAI